MLVFLEQCIRTLLFSKTFFEMDGILLAIPLTPEDGLFIILSYSPWSVQESIQGWGRRGTGPIRKLIGPFSCHSPI